MFNKLKTLIAVTALSGTVSTNAHAETITIPIVDNLNTTSFLQHSSVVKMGRWDDFIENLMHFGDELSVGNTGKKYDGLKGKSLGNHESVSQIKEGDKLITNLIQPGLLTLKKTNHSVEVKQETPILPVAEVAKGLTPAVAESAPTASELSKALTAVLEDTTTKISVLNPEPESADDAPAIEVSTQAPAQEEVASVSEEQAPKKSTPVEDEASSDDSSSPREITVKATAYTASCEGCSGITKTGINIKENPNEKVIAVDPDVIPLGSKVYVEGFGEAIAADTGGAIKGNRIDIFIPSEHDAVNFGVKHLKVKILN